MRKTLLSLFLFYSFAAAAQETLKPIFLKNGTYVPKQKVGLQFNTIELLKDSKFRDAYFGIIQLKQLPNNEMLKQLNNEGIELLQYLGSNSYTAVFKKNITNTQNILSIEKYPEYLKYDNAILSHQSVSKNNITYLAISFSGISLNEIKDALNTVHINTVNYKLESDNTVYINYDAAQVKKIAALPYVTLIDLLTDQLQLLNGESRAAHGVSAVAAIEGRGLSGSGIAIGHGDLGVPADHIDIAAHSINRYAQGGYFHGNFTSGVAAGAGIIDPKYKGVAPKASIINNYFTDVLVNTPAYIADYNMVASNNSYFSGEGGCPGNREYNSLSNYVDAQTFNYQSNLHVFAAGNDGTITCTPFTASFGTIKSGFQTGKNVLTVGSINTTTYVNAALSSRGPVRDGRIKPEIVAKGENNFSTLPVNIYGFNSGGTSMAAPVVTGAIALLQERYKQLNSGSTANSALMKALLCNTANDLGNIGPDYAYGFGMVNVRKAVESLEANQIITGVISTTNAENNHSITIPSNTRRVKVMLYWIDRAAASNAINTLINDLDLTVTEPSSLVHNPFILDPTPTNVNNIAVEGVDHLNNIEQVTIENPVAGNYNIKVKGYALPFANQNYVVVYQFDQNGITLEYPYGNEKLVPGEVENIKWEAHGNESNTFTVEFSPDNGVSWNILDNNVSSNARSFSWTVPNTITNNALIRVNRNGTAYTDMSNYNFTILGISTVTLTQVCDGNMQVNWNAIPGATSYDVLLIDADSMKVVGNTTSLNFVIGGLQNNKSYWFSVQAVNGSTSGRQCPAISGTPVGGPCSLPIFNNDIKVESINQPNTARQYTNDAPLATRPIILIVRNNSSATITGTVAFHYSINGGATVTENESVNITPGQFHAHQFAQHATSSLPADYNIKVWVDNTGDTQKKNDTITKLVRLLSNQPVTLPIDEGFESTSKQDYTNTTLGIWGNDHFDFKNTNYNGRGRTFVNTGFERTGNRAFTLDHTPYGPYSTDSLLATYNFSNYDTATHQMRIDFYYKDHGQENYPFNKAFIRGSENNNWIPAYDFTSTQNIGIYNKATINVNDILASATPKQNVSNTFQIAFSQFGATSAIQVAPQTQTEDGYTFDDIRIQTALNDISLTEIVSPTKNVCNLSAATPITVKIKNYEKNTLTNIQVNYRINNGSTVSEVIPSLTGQTSINYTFATPANLSAFMEYNIDFWVSVAGDTYLSNDSIVKYNFYNSPLINSFPYLEKFETNDGYWYAKGTNSSWEWGTPTKTIINKAANGTKAWVTSLTGNYNNNETSYLTSPCFDLTGMANPILSFSHILSIEDNCDCDYSWVEYSTDAGVTWQKLGSSGQGTNWYDNASKQSWQLSKTYWHVASINLPTNSATTKFRFVMSADPGLGYGGVGIDDIHVFDKASIYTGSPIVTGLSQSVAGTNWIHFTNGGNRIASINPNGNDLGVTSVQVHPYAGPVRNSNLQYYVNRNIVIQPATQPTSDVTIRFYFTDAEVEQVLNASGCGACTTPLDAYVLGVTKFSGTVANENGTLDDNTDNHTFILPVNVEIIPYDNGYYAEYKVNSFSEFWLNHGGPAGNIALPVSLTNFTATKIDKKVTLNWVTTNEINLKLYEIQRSKDGSNFNTIGTVDAQNAATNQYSFTDHSPLSNSNYYKLKIIDKNGTTKYSPIRIINFGADRFYVTVSPNPTTSGIVQINATDVIKEIQILDISGKLLWQQMAQSNNEIINLSQLSSGVYQLKVMTPHDFKIVKLIKE